MIYAHVEVERNINSVIKIAESIAFFDFESEQPIECRKFDRLP